MNTSQLSETLNNIICLQDLLTMDRLSLKFQAAKVAICQPLKTLAIRIGTSDFSEWLNPSKVVLPRHVNLPHSDSQRDGFNGIQPETSGIHILRFRELSEFEKLAPHLVSIFPNVQSLELALDGMDVNYKLIRLITKFGPFQNLTVWIGKLPDNEGPGKPNMQIYNILFRGVKQMPSLRRFELEDLNPRVNSGPAAFKINFDLLSHLEEFFFFSLNIPIIWPMASQWPHQIKDLWVGSPLKNTWQLVHYRCIRKMVNYLDLSCGLFKASSLWYNQLDELKNLRAVHLSISDKVTVVQVSRILKDLPELVQLTLTIKEFALFEGIAFEKALLDKYGKKHCLTSGLSPLVSVKVLTIHIEPSFARDEVFGRVLAQRLRELLPNLEVLRMFDHRSVVIGEGLLDLLSNDFCLGQFPRKVHVFLPLVRADKPVHLWSK